MAKKKAKQASKRVKKASDNPYGEAKAKLLKSKEKYRQDQVVHFDKLRKAREA